MPLMCHYLLVYNLVSQQLIHQDEFRDPKAAADAYSAMEAQHRNDEDLEIVLVGADSIETIRRTHAHYFDDEPAASPYLTGV